MLEAHFSNLPSNLQQLVLDLVSTSSTNCPTSFPQTLNMLSQDLVSKDANEVYMELAAAIQRADVIATVPGTPEQMALEEECRTKFRDCAGARIDPVAEEALLVLDKVSSAAPPPPGASLLKLYYHANPLPSASCISTPPTSLPIARNELDPRRGRRYPLHIACARGDYG